MFSLSAQTIIKIRYVPQIVKKSLFLAKWISFLVFIWGNLTCYDTKNTDVHFSHQASAERPAVNAQ